MPRATRWPWKLASRGITVSAVAPGIIAIGHADGAFDAATIRRLPRMQRTGEPAEVADLVGFLDSDQAGYISGQVISTNGGLIWSLS